MTIELSPLPYPHDALAPWLQGQTLAIHHGKHHAAYVANCNRLIAGTTFATQPLREIVVATAGKPEHSALFDNAAQAWNHAFYWQSMKPSGGGRPDGAIAHKIVADFGSHEKFVELFTEAGTKQFGSGWVWLSLHRGKLEVGKTSNAATPLTNGATPLLTMDVWEHAYYLDYQNRRPDYIRAFLDHLVHWDFANHNLAEA